MVFFCLAHLFKRINQLMKPHTLIIFASLLLNPVSNAFARMHCEMVQGEFFSSFVTDDCLSPVGMCTDGSLTGDLESSYNFSINTMEPIDARWPHVLHFHATSTLTLTADGHDQIMGSDDGVLMKDENPLRASRFTAVSRIVEGTGEHEHVFGNLFIQGEVNFIDGTTTGQYAGWLCHEP
jgi:hypothetical protein